jgi:hypothetical protein
MSRLISKLPDEIKMIALDYSITKTNDLVCAFDWSETREGWEIWDEVHNSNYQPFYDYHSIKSKPTPKQWCEEKGYNEYHVMIIEQYLNDIGK